MTRISTVSKLTVISTKAAKYNHLLRAFLSGSLLPFSFAPFHFPGAAILGLALFYAQLNRGQSRHAFLNGLFFGLGYFGLGTSWIYVSIHEYGHLNSFISAFITLVFLLYLSLFPAIMAFVYRKLTHQKTTIFSCLLFSSLWILFEFFRSTFLSGFPWLLIGFGQFDAPIKHLLPIVGVLGVGFLTCFAATLLTTSTQQTGVKRYIYLAAFVLLLLSPVLLKPLNWAKENPEPISVGVIQANLSMRDKWDENLFWQLLERYKQDTDKLLGTKLIVMPESAIPLPPSYIENFLSDIHERAKQAGSAVMLGIPQPTSVEENYFFNALITLGQAKGSYLKQHLVPFGEYIPGPLQAISNWLAIPDADLKPGQKNQPLVKVQKHTVATLICYELAFGDLLRHQLPKAEWIVSISDDGWFGRSLAMYQHLQMAQVRSLETARYQVVANNDGLSSIINTKGEIVSSLPAFSAGILKAELFSATGLTPWVYFGNLPILLVCALITLIYTGFRIKKSKLNT
ncbi:apolipoprotein N-acyltransferase [Legionella micdadei]|uniref:Apolipoprotein N-acyltransferase n=1 Tax=Legionella micdadei TaxID=451 RepID=A0A098GEE9_LEGMI|nr:apolipoprotein N-acyltransferase [Legionella micdadei]ARG97582.1 apolipoprotein N-acyltransferase [Legionella micdadei]ARH00106.1 apolipoprotein N-acyltransferase [Legionella micdadei]KTD27661.1 apolipoprotein N-acyltransferase [Legionella micdadei]NSL17645.1 apolipoprotein N-acyltransferase [Legionella micdadei]CEG60853.1 Apolipoprotein N-acyltransferase [Legionella micdadei]